jgi:hypothetical protein
MGRGEGGLRAMDQTISRCLFTLRAGGDQSEICPYVIYERRKGIGRGFS